MGYISYSDINKYGEVSFIGGSDIIFEFNVYDAGGLADMSGAESINWRMSKYGEPESTTILLSANTTTITDITYPVYAEAETGFVFVKLDGSLTENLYGKYTHQLEINVEQSNLIPSQGVILIVPKIR